MIEMNDTLKILKFIIDFMDPKVKVFFEEIEKEQEMKYCKGNNKINDKKNDDYVICDFAFEWIITLFTRYFEDYNKIYRIFDYLMVSHSLAIYFLSAEIIIDFYKKLEDKDKESLRDKAGQFDYYVKKLEFEKIDFDYYIQKCEENLQKYIGNSKFAIMYKNLKLNKFYPVISEQPFVEKWVMCNNRQEYKSNIWNYLMGQWGLFKSIFTKDEEENDNNSNKKNKKKK